MPQPKLIPTILCGGAGSRLWPVSRELHPKPFIKHNNLSFLQTTFLRANELPAIDETITVTNKDIFFKIEDEYQSVNLNNTHTSFILEPVGRNTAAAIAMASLYALSKYKEDIVLLILPADHLITKSEAFVHAVECAIEFAKQNKIVTFGIKPTQPITGYGYIESRGNEVLKFVEKPSIEQARIYLQSENFLWNSGIFCARVSTLVDEFSKHCNSILERSKQCLENSHMADGAKFSLLDIHKESYQKVPEISFDYAIMEHSDKAAVVPCDIGWIDVGSWQSMSALVEKDTHGNSVQGKALLHNAVNCYIHSEERLVSAVGISNLVIVDTADAVLVANMDFAEDVKHIYSSLKSTGDEVYKLHKNVHRPWGSYTILGEGLGYKIKRIEVKSGASLSLQLHKHRSEHWIVIQGTAKVINGENEFTINANESTFISANQKHRLSNPANELLIIIEVQTGDYLGEDDIIRFMDIYGRN